MSRWASELSGKPPRPDTTLSGPAAGKTVPMQARQSPDGPVIWGSVSAPVTPVHRDVSAVRYTYLKRHCGTASVAFVIFTVYQFCNIHHFLYSGTPAYAILNFLDAAVPWFFVLAGFLLFEPVARAVVENNPRHKVRKLLTGTATRLVPVYYATILTVWFSRQQNLPGDWRDLLEHLTFTQVFDEKRIFYTDGPAWAISVVMLTCLALVPICAAVSWMGHRCNSRRQRVTVLATTVAGLAFASLGWKECAFQLWHRPISGSFTVWFGPIAKLDNFACGMAVAVLFAATRDGKSSTRRQRATLRLVAAAILAATCIGGQTGGWTAVFFSSNCSVAFACLLAATVLGHVDVEPSRRPSRRYLVLLSSGSYGIYLWHEPLLLALNDWHGLVRQSPDAFRQDALVVVLASVVAGWLTCQLGERPTYQLTHFQRRPTAHPDTKVSAPSRSAGCDPSPSMTSESVDCVHEGPRTHHLRNPSRAP